jgi:hypothetical protein
MNLTEAEKGYLAGLFDGEGCVGYYERWTKAVPYHSASLHVCMTDRRAPEWIMNKVGYGKISFSQKSGERKSVYSWQLCNKPQIQEVLKAIRPYLTVKGEQVDLLFELWKAEEAFPIRVVSPELINIRENTMNRIKLLKQTVEGVETRRAQPLAG